MAHMIENGMLAYKGQTPWHGLGERVEKGSTGKQMLVAAKMDWPVEALKLPGDKTIKASELAPWRAVTRMDNGHVFQIVSQIYKPVQNEAIVDFFREYCEAGHAEMETVGAIRNGSTVWALAKLNGGDATLKGGDKTKGYMLLATSHDGSIPTIGKPTMVRVVCNNTLTAALSGWRRDARKGAPNFFRLIHNQKFDKAAQKQAQEVMGMAVQQMEASNEIAAQLAKVRFDEDARLEFVERLVLSGSVLDAVVETQYSGKNSEGSILDQAVAVTQRQTKEEREKRIGFIGRSILEAIITSPGSDLASAKGTAWGAVNGATFYADHGAKAFTHDNRLYNTWFGKNDSLKTKAMSVAIEMAGIQTPNLDAVVAAS
jgi:phage/plasmid-like protein (TIGR03299 family)